MKYIKGRLTRNHILTVMATVIFVALLRIILPVSAEDSMTAYCYRDNRYIDTVVIFDTSTAAIACNNLYYDCKGKCIGCLHDFDYVDYVCVDKSGRTFLR